MSKNNQTLIKSKDEYFAVPELVKGIGLPILGCQFHPEKNDCGFFASLVDNFIKENFNITENAVTKTIKETATS